MNRFLIAGMVLWVLILLLSLTLDYWLRPFGVDSTYQHAITVEIFGSGIIAFIISIFSLIFQSKLDDQSRKIKATNYFEGWLKKELYRSFLRNSLGWNFTDLTNKYYFGNTFINSISDKYIENLQQIWEFRNNLQDFPTFKLFEEIFDEIQLGYIEAEKLENQLQTDFLKWHNMDREYGMTDIFFRDSYLCFRTKLFIPKNIEDCLLHIKTTKLNKETMVKNADLIIQEQNKDYTEIIKKIMKYRRSIESKIEILKTKVSK